MKYQVLNSSPFLLIALTNLLIGPNFMWRGDKLIFPYQAMACNSFLAKKEYFFFLAVAIFTGKGYCHIPIRSI